jgi:pilus assembly protein Flp/PilA
MRKLVNRFLRDEAAASLAEYSLLLVLVAIVCIAAVTVLGTNVSSVFSTFAASY